MNHYVLLEVPADAGEDAIRAAYRRLARQYHPDAGEGSSTEKFREIREAYETLIDPERRRAYDLYLARPAAPREVRPEPMVTRSWRAEPPIRHWQMLRYAEPDLFILVDELFRSLQEDFFFGPSLFR